MEVAQGRIDVEVVGLVRPVMCHFDLRRLSNML